MSEIIEIKQIPIIVERLQTIKADVTARVDDALSLACTEETVKAVKQARSDLNKEFKDWEAKRGEVKRAIMSPYEQFEAVYKDCITDVFKKADTELKDKIAEVENGVKKRKAAEVKEYFIEYAQSRNIDFLTFEMSGIKVGLSDSLKKLKEQTKAFIDRVSDDLNLIETQEHSTEILVEYKKSLSVSSAITTVVERYKAIEAEKEREAERQLFEQQAREAEKAVDEIITASKEPAITLPMVEESDPVLTLAFKVTAPKSKLKELKTFLINGGYDYE